MKKDYFKNISSLLLISLFFFGCQKESKQITKQTNEVVSASNAESLGGCRLTSYEYYSVSDDYHQVDLFTYKNGLLDDWISYGWRYNMEYNAARKLIISRVYDGETLLFTIHFIYKNNKVTKEIWYDGNTTNIADEVFYTYNQQGNILRNESFISGYYTTYIYYENGGLNSYLFSLGGQPFQKGEFTYYDNYRNPYLAIAGLDYSFAYVTPGFGIGFGKRWYSSEKITIYDENGDPFTYYEQDPGKTIWQAGGQHYPLQSNYIDMWTLSLFTNTFTYENCWQGGNNSNASRISTQQSATTNTKLNHRIILVHNPNKSMKEQAAELRRQFNR